MKTTKLLFTLLALLGMTQAAAQDYEYVPLVREGVKWVYYYVNSDDVYPPDPNLAIGTVFLNLELKGDTIINGKTVEITPAYTRYSMQQKVNENLLKIANPELRLPVIFNFAKPDIFWNEGIDLFDSEGYPISPNTPNTYVFCDTADTFWRVSIEKCLDNVIIHDFASVEEYAKAVGNTMLYSRGLNNVEKIGYAALATGDQATKAVYDFAKTNNVPISIAQLYFDITLKPTTVQTMLLGKKPELSPVLGRQPKEAQTLYEQMARTFTKGSANYNMASIMDCLQEIPAHQVAMAELEGCDTKEACIAGVLTTWLVKRQRTETKQVA